MTKQGLVQKELCQDQSQIDDTFQNSSEHSHLSNLFAACSLEDKKNSPRESFVQTRSCRDS